MSISRVFVIMGLVGVSSLSFMSCTGSGRVTISEAGLVNTPSSVVSSLKEGRIDRNRAIELLAQELPKAVMIREDGFDPVLPTATNPSGQAEKSIKFSVQSIAEAVAEIHLNHGNISHSHRVSNTVSARLTVLEGSEHKTLEDLLGNPDCSQGVPGNVDDLAAIDDFSDLGKILGLDAFSARGSKECVVDLFFKKLAKDYVFSDNNWDAFLIRYLLIRNLRAESKTDRIPMIRSARAYFEKRLKWRIHREIDDVSRMRHEKPASILTRVEEGCANPDMIQKNAPKTPPELADLERRASLLVHEYAGLANLVSGNSGADKWFLNAFSLLTSLASFRSGVRDNLNYDPTSPDTSEEYQTLPLTPILSQRLYYRVLKAWVRQPDTSKNKNRMFSVCQIHNALDHAAAAITRAKLTADDGEEAEVVYYLLQASIDYVNALFDKNPSRFRGLTSEAWYEFLDQRFYKVMRPFRLLVPVLASRGSLNEALRYNQFTPRHPYTRVYFNRALIEMSDGRWMGSLQYLQDRRIDPDRKIQEMLYRFREFEGDIEKFYGMGSPDKRVAAEENQESNDMRQYLWGFYRVEQLRYFLEEDSARDNQTIKDHGDERIDLYLGMRPDPEYQKKYSGKFRPLREELARTLDIRYRDRVEERLARIPDDMQQECLIQNGKMKYFSMCNIDDSSTVARKPGILIFEPRSEVLEIGAGIYEVAADSEIVAKRVNFHPLAMLWGTGIVKIGDEERMPQIRLVAADGVYDPWIDVTGETRIRKRKDHLPLSMGKAPTRGEMQKCFIHQWDVNPDPLTGEAPDSAAVFFEKDKDIMQAKGGKGHHFFWKSCHPLSSPGIAPDAPYQAGPGVASGSINLIAPDRTSRGFPLLVALGGDGQQGFDGISSPRCSETGRHIELKVASFDTAFGGQSKYMCMDGRGVSLVYNNRDSQGRCFGRTDFQEALNKWNAFGTLDVADAPPVASGRGGSGGNSGSGGEVHATSIKFTHQKAVFTAPGRPGLGGAPGRTCGQNGTLGVGQIGESGAAGTFRE